MDPLPGLLPALLPVIVGLSSHRPAPPSPKARAVAVLAAALARAKLEDDGATAALAAELSRQGVRKLGDLADLDEPQVRAAAAAAGLTLVQANRLARLRAEVHAGGDLPV